MRLGIVLAVILLAGCASRGGESNADPRILAAQKELNHEPGLYTSYADYELKTNGRLVAMLKEEGLILPAQQECFVNAVMVRLVGMNLVHLNNAVTGRSDLSAAAAEIWLASRYNNAREDAMQDAIGRCRS